MQQMPDNYIINDQIEELTEKMSALRSNITNIADSVENLNGSSVSDLLSDIASVVRDINDLDDAIDDIDTKLENLPDDIASLLGSQRKLPTIDNAADEYLWADCLTLYETLKNKPRREEILKSFIDRANIL